MKLRMLFILLVIGLSVSSCKKNNSTSFKYEVVNEENAIVKLSCYDQGNSLIVLDENYIHGKKNKFLVPEECVKLKVYIGFSGSSTGYLDYKINSESDQLSFEGSTNGFLRIFNL
jgi:hypothetical protein